MSRLAFDLIVLLLPHLPTPSVILSSRFFSFKQRSEGDMVCRLLQSVYPPWKRDLREPYETLCYIVDIMPVRSVAQLEKGKSPEGNE
jgi:hypothetical protein